MPAASSKGASAPVAVTTAVQFFNASSDGAKLFQVRPGHSLSNALEHASCFLASARDMAYADVHGRNAFSVGVMVEMAKSLVDAITLPDGEAIAECARAADALAEALVDLVTQVQSGGAANEVRALAALSAWNATKGGAA